MKSSMLIQSRLNLMCMSGKQNFGRCLILKKNQSNRLTIQFRYEMKVLIKSTSLKKKKQRLTITSKASNNTNKRSILCSLKISQTKKMKRNLLLNKEFPLPFYPRQLLREKLFISNWTRQTGSKKFFVSYLNSNKNFRSNCLTKMGQS